MHQNSNPHVFFFLFLLCQSEFRIFVRNKEHKFSLTDTIKFCMSFLQPPLPPSCRGTKQHCVLLQKWWCFQTVRIFCVKNVIFYQNIWAATWQHQQSDCAPSEDSDQPGHPPSLIRVFGMPSLIWVFAVRMKKHWVLSYPLSAQRRLWSAWADAQADLSLRWAHSHFVGFVISWLICLLKLLSLPFQLLG